MISKPFFLCLLLALVGSCAGGGEVHVSASDAIEEGGEKPPVEWLNVIGRRDRPLFAVSIEIAADRNLDVYSFGGGPLASSYSPTIVRHLNNIYGKDAGHIKLVEYSGSTCCNEYLLERLKLEGMSALEKDAKSIADYIVQDHKANPDKKYGFNFNSFSTLLGVVLVSELEARDVPVNFVVFVAPWIRHESSEYVYSAESRDLKINYPYREKKKQKYASVNKKYLHIDEGLPSDEGREWMQRIRDQYSFSTPTLAIIAEYDNRSPVSFAVDYFESMCCAEVFIAKRSFHGTALASDESRQTARRFVRRQLAED